MVPLDDVAHGQKRMKLALLRHVEHLARTAQAERIRNKVDISYDDEAIRELSRVIRQLDYEIRQERGEL